MHDIGDQVYYLDRNPDNYIVSVKSTYFTFPLYTIVKITDPVNFPVYHLQYNSTDITAREYAYEREIFSNCEANQEVFKILRNRGKNDE